MVPYVHRDICLGPSDRSLVRQRIHIRKVKK